jgi:hypothetical protein
MTAHVFRNENLPDATWLVDVSDAELDGFVAAWEGAGWSLSDTDPADVSVPPTVPPEDRQAERPAADPNKE